MLILLNVDTATCSLNTSSLCRFFAGTGLLQPVPQQPSEELLGRLTDVLNALWAGCSWAEGLLGVLSR